MGSSPVRACRLVPWSLEGDPRTWTSSSKSRSGKLLHFSCKEVARNFLAPKLRANELGVKGLPRGLFVTDLLACQLEEGDTFPNHLSVVY